MTCDGVANGFAHDQTHSESTDAENRFGGRLVDSTVPVEYVHDEVTPPDSMAAAHRPGEVCVVMQPMWLRQHPSVRTRRYRSGGQCVAALTATRRNDCATRTGPHPETEAVNTRAASVVRLERPLALGHGEHSSKIVGTLVVPNGGLANLVVKQLWSNTGDAMQAPADPRIVYRASPASTKRPPHQRVTVRE